MARTRFRGRRIVPISETPALPEVMARAKLDGGIPAYASFLHEDINRMSGQRKWRLIYDPNKPMRAIHHAFMVHLRKIIKQMNLVHATGGMKHCSPARNVRYHRSNRFFYLTDIHAAYTQVDCHRMAEVLCTVYDPWKDRQDEVEVFLQQFCFLPEGGLITGALSSPDAFNIYAGHLLDIALGHIAREHGLTYTRYLDDLTFSSPHPNPIDEELRREIRVVVSAAGFTVSHRKSKVLDTHKGDITINGIGLSWKGRVYVPQKYMHKLSGMLHCSLRGQAVNRNQIYGYMGTFRSILYPDKRLTLGDEAWRDHTGRRRKQKRTQAEKRIVKMYWQWLSLRRWL